MDAYERVLGDAMTGDRRSSPRRLHRRGVRIVDPVLRADTPVHEYDPGTWGPPMHRSFPWRLARAGDEAGRVVPERYFAPRNRTPTEASRMHTETIETPGHARELFLRHHTRYEVSRYLVLLDVRTFGVPPSQRRIHAGFDVDLYGSGFDHSSIIYAQRWRASDCIERSSRRLPDCRRTGGGRVHHRDSSRDATLILNPSNHLEPEALVRIRIFQTADDAGSALLDWAGGLIDSTQVGNADAHQSFQAPDGSMG